MFSQFEFYRLQVIFADLARRVHEHRQEIRRDSVRGVGLSSAEHV